MEHLKVVSEGELNKKLRRRIMPVYWTEIGDIAREKMYDRANLTMLKKTDKKLDSWNSLWWKVECCGEVFR